MKYCALHPIAGWRNLKVLRAYRHAQETLRGDRSAGAALRQTAHAAAQTHYDEAVVNACVQRWMEDAPLSAVGRARFDGLDSFCAWAAGRGLRMGALSDYDPREKLHALGVASYFSVSAWAQEAEVGVFKPNPRGLRIVLERLGVEPGEAIYVGDRLEVDGAAAIACGVLGVLISSRPVTCPPGVIAVKSWIELRDLLDLRLDGTE